MIQAGTNSTSTTTAAAAVGLDPTLTAATVSAIVSIIIWVLIEPRIWQARFSVKRVDRSIQIHSWLISVLKSCQQKTGRLPETERRLPYLLESDDVRKLEDIFEKNAYLMGDKLKQTWYDVQRSDTTFLLDRVKHRDPSQLGRYNTVALDLTEMQREAEAEMRSRITLGKELLRFGGILGLTSRGFIRTIGAYYGEASEPDSSESTE